MQRRRYRSSPRGVDLSEGEDEGVTVDFVTMAQPDPTHGPDKPSP